MVGLNCAVKLQEKFLQNKNTLFNIQKLIPKKERINHIGKKTKELSFFKEVYSKMPKEEIEEIKQDILAELESYKKN